jgi:hypothetical protein
MATTSTTAKTTEATSALTDAIVSGVKQSQDLMLSGISAWVDFTGKAFNAPKVEGLPFMDSMPDAKEIVDASFGFVEELLKTQKEFAYKLVDAVPAKSA